MFTFQFNLLITKVFVILYVIANTVFYVINTVFAV